MGTQIKTYKLPDGVQVEMSCDDIVGQVTTLRLFPPGSDNMGTNYVELPERAFTREYVLEVMFTGELVRDDYC